MNHSKTKKVVMSEKRKELVSLKRSLEQKKLIFCCERGDAHTLRSIIAKYRHKRKLHVLRALLEYEDASNQHRTPLVYCCISGNVGCLLELLRSDVDLAHFVGGSSPLYHAVSRGHVECVEELLIYGAAPNVVNQKGWTCLQNAAYFGRTTIVALLLKYGANPDLPRADLKCALHFAAKNGRLDAVHLLLEYGANANLVDADEAMTPLMYGAQNGYYGIVQLLMVYGANPLLRSKQGKCAIDFISSASSTSTGVSAVKDAEMFSFMQQSAHIYNAIQTLVVPDTLRNIIRSLRRMDREYPPILAQLRSVSHMSQLAQLELAMHRFNRVICGQLTADLSNLNPISGSAELLYIEDSHVQFQPRHAHERVLHSFRSGVTVCTKRFDRCQSDLTAAQNGLRAIETEMSQTKHKETEILAQIALLQQQLRACRARHQQLQPQRASHATLVHHRNTAMADLAHELSMKRKICVLVQEASQNIRKVCETGRSVPSRYMRELRVEYHKKRDMLEESWPLWSLDDVITWICSLHATGRFGQYKRALQKLKQLEDRAQMQHRRTRSKHARVQKRPQKHRKKEKLRQDAVVKPRDIYEHFFDNSQEEYDGDEGKSDELQDELMHTVSATAESEENEGKNDGGGVLEEFPDAHVYEEIAIADAASAGPIASQAHNCNVTFEGFYNVKYTDSEASCNDKHGASQVVVAALMPKNDESSSDDADSDGQDADTKQLTPFEVDQLLQTMDDDEDDDDEAFHEETKRSTVSTSSSDDSQSGPDEAILDSINSTVLKMCGIRDREDRKFIMQRIEALKQRTAAPATAKSRADFVPDKSANESHHNSVEQVGAATPAAPSTSPPPHASMHLPVKTPDNADISDMEAIQKSGDDNESHEIEALEDAGQIPSEFKCPILGGMMKDPVICSDGHSYERTAIEHWLQTHEKSPLSTQKLETKQVFPNHSLRSMIELYNKETQQQTVAHDSVQKSI